MGIAVADGRIKEFEGTSLCLVADSGDHRQNYETPHNRTNHRGRCSQHSLLLSMVNIYLGLPTAPEAEIGGLH